MNGGKAGAARGDMRLLCRDCLAGSFSARELDNGKEASGQREAKCDLGETDGAFPAQTRRNDGRICFAGLRGYFLRNADDKRIVIE